MNDTTTMITNVTKMTHDDMKHQILHLRGISVHVCVCEFVFDRERERERETVSAHACNMCTTQLVSHDEHVYACVCACM